MNRRLSYLFLLAQGISSGIVFSSPAVANEPVFAIKSYTISGNTLLPDGDLQQTVARFVGEQESFQTIQNALKALEAKFAEAGYASVRVMLPEQEVDNGHIQLKIIEATLGTVELESSKYFSKKNIRDSLPALREGEIPNMDKLSASLRVANENASKQTSLVFRPATQDNQIDALLRVVDENPLKLGISFDNTGTSSTGDYRLGLLAQHANLFDLDHIISAQVITSPGHESDVKILGLGYKIPLYGLGDSIDLAYGYSNVDSGSVSVAGSTLGISGSGHIASAKYNIYLPAIQNWEQKIALGLDYRAYSNKVQAADAPESLVPDITVRPVSLTYSGQVQREGFDFSTYLNFAQNVAGGKNGSSEDFTASRSEATASYNLIRYGLNFGYTLPASWFLRATVAGQFTNDALVSGEQFGVGGHDTVRGFQEREIAKDKGVRGSVELYTPNIAAAMGLNDARAQALIFYDAAQVKQNHALADEQISENIASTGLGVRIAYTRNISLKFDYGVVTQAGGAKKVGDSRLHGSLLWFF